MARYQIVEDGSVVGFVDSDGGSFTWSYSGEKAKIQSLLTYTDSFKTPPHIRTVTEILGWNTSE
jgi:hypothetical protein